MFYFRINRLRIVDNRESPRFILFGPDKAEVDLLSFITTDNTNISGLDELMTTNDTVRKKGILEEAIKKVISCQIFTTIENVRDNHIMTFGDTGYVLFKSEKIPEDFNWLFLAYENDNDIRNTGILLNEIVNDPKFDSFTGNIVKVIGAVANPAAAAGFEIGKFIANAAGKILQRNKHDMIGVLYMSLNRREHYLYGERKKDNVNDLTNNMFIDYSIFAYENAKNAVTE